MNNGRLIAVDDGIPAALYVKRVLVSAKGRTKEQVEAMRSFWETLASREKSHISWFREDDRYIGCYRPR